MKRKVNKVGQNTLTVSLPSKWVEKNNIQKGDELEFEQKHNSIIFSKKALTKKDKKITLNIDDFDIHMLKRHMYEFYIEGVEEITFTFTKTHIPHRKKDKHSEIQKNIKKLTERFIGIEIVSNKKNSITLQSLITSDDVEKIDTIKKRIYFLIKEFCNQFIEYMDNDFKEFHDQSYTYHDSIAKFSYYYLRLLHFSKYRELQKVRLFSLFILIDKIIDKLRHASERVNEMKTRTPKIKNYLKEIFDLFIAQFDLITNAKPKFSTVQELVKQRYNLVNRVNKEKFSEKELKVISEIKIMLDTINDFCETSISLHMDKYLKGEH